MTFKTGEKIKFKSEKKRYTIQACDERFLICTKPFAARKTYIYTVVDLKENVRGTVNLIFGPAEDYSRPEEAQMALKEFRAGNYEVSHRNRIPLDLE